jgi:hypothetical protein
MTPASTEPIRVKVPLHEVTCFKSVREEAIRLVNVESKNKKNEWKDWKSAINEIDSKLKFFYAERRIGGKTKCIKGNLKRWIRTEEEFRKRFDEPLKKLIDQNQINKI